MRRGHECERVGLEVVIKNATDGSASNFQDAAIFGLTFICHLFDQLTKVLSLEPLAHPYIRKVVWGPFKEVRLIRSEAFTKHNVGA